MNIIDVQLMNYMRENFPEEYQGGYNNRILESDAVTAKFYDFVSEYSAHCCERAAKADGESVQELFNKFLFCLKSKVLDLDDKEDIKRNKSNKWINKVIDEKEDVSDELRAD